MAERWLRSLGQEPQFPTGLRSFIARCSRAGQRRPTPLLLRYTRRYHWIAGYNTASSEEKKQYDIEGLSQTAAARRLGISTSGMKSRVQRGRARLKETLLRCCQIHLDRNGGILDYESHSRTCC